ncbi:SH3 domain-containing protein [Streptomyces sp. NPDC001276]|uniref:SH3 domain-containing protein n=1 Tax=Streptomyces sp. NPDC001276 TaxID=3364555 RepID=UPI0036A0D737
MPLRSPLTRLAMAAATGALLSMVAVAPATADDGRSGHRTAASQHGTTPEQGTPPQPSTAGRDSGAPDHRHPRFYRGVVTARGGLALRTHPDRDSRVLRVARPGRFVWIHCKTLSQGVNGNRVWYLVSDGIWAWGSARHIANIGPSPRWC